METETTLLTELLSKRRILHYLGVRAHEIPYYLPQELWVEAAAYQNGDRGTATPFRSRLVKNRPSADERLDQVRQIVCAFERDYNATACGCMLTRSPLPEETEVDILYVTESGRAFWADERRELRELRPMAFVCKLHNPKSRDFRRLTCRVDAGFLAAGLVLDPKPGSVRGSDVPTALPFALDPAPCYRASA